MKKIWKWLRTNLINKKMIIPTLIGEIIFWGDLIAIAILSLFKPALWAVFGSVYFIQVTILPAIPIQLGIIFFISKIINKRKKTSQ